MSIISYHYSSPRKLLKSFIKISILVLLVTITIYSTLNVLKPDPLSLSSSVNTSLLRIEPNPRKQIHNERIQILLLPFTDKVGPICHPDYANGNCSFDNRCYFTDKLSSWNESHAVIIHANYRSRMMPELLPRPIPSQIWIWMQHEAPPNHWFRNNYEQLKNSSDRFNWTYTYRLDSDVLATYGRLYPKDKLPNSFRSFAHPLASSVPPLKTIGNESIPAVWVVSKCQTFGLRERIVKELGKYIPIHIYGSCGGTECLLSRKDSSASQLCHPSLAQNRYHYKFYLSFENSLCTDYVTEKFFSILDTSMIPIVYGGADYKAMFPPYSYIDVMDFPSVQALAKYLTQLLQHPKQYAKYFQWRSEYYLLNDPWLPGYCEICQKLLIRQAKQMKRGEEELEDFSYANVYNWWIYGVDSETEEKKKGFKDIKLCWDEDRVNQFIMRFTGNSSK